MVGKQSKRHHYVPQGYLKGFADEREHIQVVPLDSSEKPRCPHVKNVALENNFHTTPEVPGDEDWFEKEISKVEANAIEIIRQLDSGIVPEAPDWRMELSVFIALQAVRGPETRRTTDALRGSLMRMEVGLGGKKNVGRWIQRETGRKPTPELEDAFWAEVTAPGGPNIDRPNVEHILHALDIAERLLPTIYLRAWEVVRFQRRSLLANDAPVCLVPHPDHDPMWGVGFSNAWGIAVPLTRKTGLLMTDTLSLLDDIPFFEGMKSDEDRMDWLRDKVSNGRIDRWSKGTTAMSNLFNGATVAHARRYIYHHPDDAHLVPNDLPPVTLVNFDHSAFEKWEFGEEPAFSPDPSS